MEGVNSFEQLSSSEIGHDLAQKQHRIIIADRRNPNAYWSTSNQPTARRSSFRFLLSFFRKNKSYVKPWITPSSTMRSYGEGTDPPLDYGPFCSNEWLTSKYTMLNFLPKNLFEQFRRLANFYFLITAILQTLLPFTPIGPFTSLAPLIFVVGVTSIKQAYEDFLRHKSDQEQNNRTCYVLRGQKITKVRSKDIKVGDFVYVRNNEEIPCDMILLAASGTSGDRCFVTTSNLDGEANLKRRSCSILKQRIGTIEKLNESLLIIECENPNATLYEFNGFLRAPKSHEVYDLLLSGADRSQSRFNRSKGLNVTFLRKIMFQLQRKITRSNKSNLITADEIHEIPIDITNLLPRASRLRNTSYIYGLAVYTGRDTKLAKNSHVKPNKFSSSEQQVNVFLCISFTILLLITLVSTIRYSSPSSWFLAPLPKEDSYGQIFLAHFLLYNYLLPISLYVTLEFVKFFGTLSVIKDKRLHMTSWQNLSRALPDEPTNGSIQAATNFSDKLERVKVTEIPKCNSSDLNEELGQIEVLFSDKTGTLTENQMLFIACSVGGSLYRSFKHKLYLQTIPFDRDSTINVAKEMATLKRGRPALLGSFCRSPRGSSKVHTRRRPPISTKKLFDHRVTPPTEQLSLISDIEESERLVGFLICLCLCSTITLNESIPLEKCLDTSNGYDFQSASPDEEALIAAAHSFGVTMCKSNETECFIMVKRSKSMRKSSHTNGVGTFKYLVETKSSNDKFIVRHFERRLLFEFNSSRKRMSVIYRDCDNDCFLMVSKGSEELLDCTNFHNIDSKTEKLVNETLAHFEAFSRSGLRTLLVAWRPVTQQELTSLETEMEQIKMSIHNRDYLLDRFYRLAEVDFSLLGATAVEDSLQDGVPETISNLKEAGIKIWLLTGDKVETAQSVAYLCKLLDPDMTQFHLVRQRDLQACQKLISAYIESIMTKEKTSMRNMRVDNTGFKSNRSRNKHALIADGRSLHYAMRYAQADLAKLCKKCDIVLGCRLSPLQKAEVVSMIKRDESKPITAAIGDGANDVSMIQEAHVGIGIIGKEGRQAVNSADFALGRFRMLNRLLFVHGHLFYHRTANVILYFFYKNILFIMPQFFYSFFNLSSAQSIYHPIQLVGYNLFFTSLPILFYGLHEVHVHESILERYPKLYIINRGNVQMSLTNFLTWVSAAIFQAIIIFSLIYFVWGSHTPFLESGTMGESNGFSIMLYFVIVIVVNLKLYFVARRHSFWFSLSLVISISLLPLGFYGYSLIDWSYVFNENSYYGQMSEYLLSPMFWLAIFVDTAAALAVDIMWQVRDRINWLH